MDAVIPFLFRNTMTDRLFVLLTHCMYSVIYFVLVWKDLYSFSYHFFVSRGTGVVTRKSMISSLLTIVFIMIMFVFNSGLLAEYKEVSFIRESTVVIIIDAFAYAFLFACQYLWVTYLIKIGFLGKNVIFIGNPDERIPARLVIENASQTRYLTGTIFQSGGKWYYKDRSRNKREITSGEVLDLLASLQIGEVFIFIGPDMPKESIYEIADFCRKISIGYYIIPDMEKLSRQTFWARSFPYIPYIESFVPRTDSLLLVSFKRIFDLLVIACLIPILAPLFLAVGIAIKLDDRGPVFYTSKRVGKNGRQIRFYKFRTMVRNAESQQSELMRFNERRDGPLFKMTNDPRLTRIGKYLRKYNIDELPQLLNVLKGDLSIAGPRPHLAHEVEKYTPRDLIRLESIPGIMCYPQIINDFRMGFREWMDLDLYYRNNWSIKTDVRILLELVLVLMNPKAERKRINTSGS